MLLAPGLAAPLAVFGRVEAEVFGQLMVLLLALVYYLAGIHLDRRLLPVAGLLVVGYLSLFVIADWAWTVLGVTTAAALAVCAWLAREPRDAAAA
jgi:hypothetical protein